MSIKRGPTICRARGDTDPFAFNFLQADGSPFPLQAGDSYKMTVSKEECPTDTSQQQFQMAGVVDGALTGGRILFTPASGDMDLLGDSYYYDIERTASGGEILTWFKGILSIEQDITKD